MDRQDHAGKLERARRAAGYTTTEAGAHTGRCASTVTRWERGAHAAPLDAVRNLAALYGVPVSELVA